VISVIVRESEQPLQLHDLEAAEKRLGLTFPEEYRAFLLKHNGGRPTPREFNFLDPDGVPSNSLINFFLAIYDGTIDNLEISYRTFTLKERMPANIVPIANDPFGNQICISVAGEDIGKVYFWDHEREPDEPSYENLSLIADSFNEFLSRLT
jgi:cell wall assembly regulator SMI1